MVKFSGETQLKRAKLLLLSRVAYLDQCAGILHWRVVEVQLSALDDALQLKRTQHAGVVLCTCACRQAKGKHATQGCDGTKAVGVCSIDW